MEVITTKALRDSFSVLGRKLKKIILVEPASTHIHTYARFKIPRLGCINLGSIASQLGYEVRVYVEDIHPVNLCDLSDADLVGISILTPTAVQGYKLADTLRAQGVRVVIGGIHANFMPDEALSHADFVLRGEAEETWPLFLEMLNGQHDPKKVGGLSYWEKGERIHNKDAPLPMDLDALVPLPNRDIVVGWKDNPVLSINTRRGCPFDCNFCTVWVYNGRRVRHHSPEYVGDLLRLAKRWGIGYVFFNDDIFNLPPKYALAVCEVTARVFPEARKNGQFRWETAKDDELLAALRAAGFENLCIGFESFDDQALKNMRKKETRGNVLFAIQKLRRWGFNVHGMFISGAGEKLETLRKTPKIARRLGLTTFQCMIATPLPGSDLLKELIAKGKYFLTSDHRWFDGHHAVVDEVVAGLTPAQLTKETMEAVKRFYSWPAIIASLFGSDPLRNFLMRRNARGLVDAWFRSPLNRAYLEDLLAKKAPRSEEEILAT